MGKTSPVLATLFCAGVAVWATNAGAQQTNAAKGAGTSRNAAQTSAEEDAQPSALTVGALQIAPDARLSATSVAVEISTERIVYTYGFKNGASTNVDMLATVSMPTLEATDDEKAAPQLPKREASNPVGLKVMSGGDPIPTKAHVNASALGVNRLSELNTAKIPLLPFGAETARALRDLPADAVVKLAQLGLVSRFDGAKPNEPVAPAWTLNVVREMLISLPPNAETAVNVSFAPIRADFQIGKGDDDELNSMKEDFCVSAKTLAALRSRLKSGGAWQVSELSIDVDGPSDQIDAPAASISVRKPQPEAVVAFCGANEKTLAADIVTGAAPDDNEDGELHVMLFTPLDR